MFVVTNSHINVQLNFVICDTRAGLGEHHPVALPGAREHPGAAALGVPAAPSRSRPSSPCPCRCAGLKAKSKNGLHLFVPDLYVELASGLTTPMLLR